MSSSFQNYANIPSAIISDGILPIPIWAVTQMTLTETYHLPPIGSTGAKAIVGVHDDLIALTGVLPGMERFAWKLALETMAEASKRGTALGAFTGGSVSGLILITAMTVRTDMQIQQLTFTASTTKRETLDVSIQLASMPLPGAFGKLLDLGAVGIGALMDAGGN
jgi:hypothetical protein